MREQMVRKSIFAMHIFTFLQASEGTSPIGRAKHHPFLFVFYYLSVARFDRGQATQELDTMSVLRKVWKPKNMADGSKFRASLVRVSLLSFGHRRELLLPPLLLLLRCLVFSAPSCLVLSCPVLSCLGLALSTRGRTACRFHPLFLLFCFLCFFVCGEWYN